VVDAFALLLIADAADALFLLLLAHQRCGV
jgi:hypothetical protein